MDCSSSAPSHPQCGVVVSACWRYCRKHLSPLPGLLFKQARETPAHRNPLPSAPKAAAPLSDSGVLPPPQSGARSGPGQRLVFLCKHCETISPHVCLSQAAGAKPRAAPALPAGHPVVTIPPQGPTPFPSPGTAARLRAAPQGRRSCGPAGTGL